MPKVHIVPNIDPSEPDTGQGGIGRVVRGQMATLPQHGWEIVDSPGEADLIHCHVEIPPAFLRLYPDKPYVVTCHGAYWTDGGYQWERWCYATNQKVMAAIRAATRVVTVSEWVAQALRRATMRRVDVIYHGMDAEDWTPSERHSDYVLWDKTRVDPICDTAPMNDVAALLPQVQFVSTFGNEAPNVQLIGRLPYDQHRDLVRQAGVYLATTRETFGIATIEAMAAGVPVVGYAFGGQPEIIEQGVDGWLVQPGDTKGLAEAVQWALQYRDVLSPRARAKALQFTVEATGEQYAKLFDETLAQWNEEHAPDAPRTSVIVPAYQMGDYLDDTLRSVLAQTDQSWECIVVNDASPDARDHDIAARYVAQDPRFREIVLTENGYLANARNVGMQAARGRYLFPLDADDQITPDTLEVLAHSLDLDPALHIAYGNVRFVEPDGITPTRYPGNYDPGHSGWPMQFSLEWMLRGPGQLMPVASMFRRTVWEQTGGYRVRSRSSEDQDFYLRACSYGFTPRMVTEMDTLVYRNRPDSMSRTEGWEEHRPWFPWCADRALIPAGALQDNVGVETLPMPALDPTPISVVIPVGPGHERFVIDAIDSVDAQTFRNWECIVVNDSGMQLPPLPSWVRVIEGASCEPCHGTGQQGVVGVDEEMKNYHRWAQCTACGGTGHARFGGVAQARNAGIKVSRGFTFLPLDADDYLQPRCLELMWANLIAGPEPAVIYSDFFEDPEQRGKFRIYETPDYNPRRLAQFGTLHAVTALTPKSFWEEAGGYPEDLPWEDWGLAIAIAARGHCSRRIAAPLFTYRKNTGLRRNTAIQDFEASRDAMMQHDYGLQKDGDLLACSTCGGGPQTTQTFTGFGHAPNHTAEAPEDAILLRYMGPREGTFSVRSTVNPMVRYAFSKSYPDRYVHKDDAAHLMQTGQFEQVKQTVAPDLAPEGRPALVAEREPVLVGAMAAPSGTGPVVAEAAPLPTMSPFAPGAPPALPSTAEPLPETSDEPNPDTLRELASRPMPPRAENPRVPGLLQRTREDLNAIAASLGIENAETMRTKGEVAQAVAAMQEARGL